MVRAKLKFRLHRAVIVLICLALLVALMQGASWFSQNSQKQRNPQLEELARTLLQGKRTRWQQSPFLLTANKPVEDEDDEKKGNL